MENSTIVYQKGTEENILGIVDLSLEVFEKDRYFIFNLGREFVKDYYLMIYRNYPDCFFIAIRDEKLIGFIIGYPDSKKITKSLVKKAIPFAFKFLFRKYKINMSINFFVKKVISSFGYVSREQGGGELLSMAIKKDYQGHGIGGKLVSLLEESLLKYTDKYFVHTHLHLTETVKFYEKHGFKEVTRDKKGETVVLHKNIVKR